VHIRGFGKDAIDKLMFNFALQ